jgi:hypothetical protein
MNYQLLQRQINLQVKWVDNLACQRSTDKREPLDSLRHLLIGDDHCSNYP